MPRYAPACAVLTIVVDKLHTSPTELTPTLRTMHAATSSVLLNTLRAPGALLGLFLNDRETCVFFCNAILGAFLVLCARLALMPWAVASDASFGAAIIASEDILGCRFVFLCFECGADAFTDPAGPGGTFVLVEPDRILFGAWKRLLR